jgi:hypothetical protein
MGGARRRADINARSCEEGVIISSPLFGSIGPCPNVKQEPDQSAKFSSFELMMFVAEDIR